MHASIISSLINAILHNCSHAGSKLHNHFFDIAWLNHVDSQVAHIDIKYIFQKRFDLIKIFKVQDYNKTGLARIIVLKTDWFCCFIDWKFTTKRIKSFCELVQFFYERDILQFFKKPLKEGGVGKAPLLL